jgi:hypothetical protein
VARRRAQRLAANLTLLAGGTLAGLLALELGVRWLAPQPLAALEKSPRLGWMHVPNSSLVYERDEFHIPVHFSSAGLRDREYPLAKPPGTFRIAILGDSFVEALQVPFDSCTAKRLEARLAAAPGGVRYEVLNFGVSGYGGCQELALLEDVALRFAPDLVVAFFYPNDLDDDLRFGLCALDESGALQMRPPPPARGRAKFVAACKSVLYRHSELWVFVSSRRTRQVDLRTRQPAAPALRDASPVPSCPGRHATLEWRLTLRDEPADAAAAVRLHAAIWARMDEVCRAHGARFLGVLGVSKTQLDPEVYARTLRENGCRPEAHAAELLAARVAAAATLRGAAVFDLVPSFRARSGREQLHFRIDGHWNAAGHRVASEALYADLVRRGMLTAAQFPR